MRLAGLVLAAFLLRVAAAGFGGPITPDGVYFYLPCAAAFLAGDYAQALMPTHHPGYPALVALFELLSISGEWAGRLVSVLAGAACVIPVFRIGKMLGGERCGWLAAGMLVVLPIHVEYSGWVQTEALFTLLVAWTLERCVVFAQGGPRRAVVIAGFLAGLGALVRGEAILLLVLLPCAALYRGRGDRSWLAVGGGAALLLGLAFSTSLMFYPGLQHFAYSPGSNIVFVRGQQQGPDKFDCFFEIAPDGKQLAFYYASTPEGFEPGLKGRIIREDPVRFAGHYRRGLWRLTVRFAPKGLDWAWLPAMLIGVVLLVRRGAVRGGRLPVIQFTVIMAGLAAYFVQKRFWIPLAPATLACAAVGFDHVLERAAGRRWITVLIWVAVLAALPQTFKVYQLDEGWNARHARGVARTLLEETDLRPGEYLLARNAELPFYAGLRTSELPAAGWPQCLAYARRRGADAMLVDASEAEERSWREGLESAGARSIKVDGRDSWFLDLR